MKDDFYPYVFVWDRAGRKGQRCRVWARSKPSKGDLPGADGETFPVTKRWNSVGIEFPDGFKMVTSGNAVRKAKDEEVQ